MKQRATTKRYRLGQGGMTPKGTTEKDAVFAYLPGGGERGDGLQESRRCISCPQLGQRQTRADLVGAVEGEGVDVLPVTSHSKWRKVANCGRRQGAKKP
jgi:hypothetical protein